ncbi:Uncharacterized phage-associated protein [Actinobacillus lignieresii]|uniref:Panacea domain-containing protein n=1 Tax=Actinobacillus lignieresii TaxID=720 RepID=UPI000F6EF2EC|nr:Panacea domain-containing protein [Actinobacillus lignieresii]VEB27317.1 Uncharacterized phage-associated protein [Actinobacillus lignieresii]
MNIIESIVAYLCIHYPYSGELSKTRLTKLVYLADWFSALAFNRQMTNINWVFNHYGPYVDDVIDTVSSNGNFSIEYSLNYYGTERTTISFNGLEENINLTEIEQKTLDLVISKTSPMYFNDFIKYVYSTYPIVNSNRYSHLNLVELAKECREQDNLN